MRHPNANGKTRLDNWVEERAVGEISLEEPSITMSGSNHHGHAVSEAQLGAHGSRGKKYMCAFFTNR